MDYTKRWWSDGLALVVATGSAVVMIGVDSPDAVVAVATFTLGFGGLAYLAYSADRSRAIGMSFVLVSLIVIPDLVGGATLAWHGADQDFVLYRSNVLAGSTGAVRTIIGLVWPLFIAFVWASIPKSPMVLSKSDGWAMLFLLLSVLYILGIF